MLVKCDNHFCKKQFDKPVRYLNIDKRRGQSLNFCSPGCAGAHKNQADVQEFLQESGFDLKEEEYQRLRSLVNNARIRCRPGKQNNRRGRGVRSFNMKTLDVVKQFHRQNRVCPYTGTLLDPLAKDPMKKPSLDRIDSDLGYSSNNIQLVSLCINLFKSQMTHKETVEFLDQISVYRTSLKRE